MKSVRAAAALMIAALMLCSFGQVPASAQETATIAGTATDVNGGPLSGVTITMTGPQTYTATTGDDGTYSISGVAPGTYNVTATKAGYNPEHEDQYVVTGGANANLSVALGQASLNTLKVIGRTSTRSGRLGFNSGPASVATITQQQFLDFGGSGQVMRLLDQTPGIITGHPGSTSNNGSPGAITYPVIRGSNSFETATLIDGHPVSVSDFGDFVTTFLNSNTFGSVEIVKGPGASSPVVNNAINGTVNFRTLEPTTKPQFTIQQGWDSFGGQFNNYTATGTVLNGKLGYAFVYAVNGTPGASTGQQYLFTPGSGVSINGGAAIGFPTNSIAIPSVRNNPQFGQTSLLACCYPISDTFMNKGELGKVRVNFSPVTSFTASYLGGQTWSNQQANVAYTYPSIFIPGAGYTTTNGYSSGTAFNTIQGVFFPPDEFELDNEPIFQFDLRTSVGNDTILARYYTASLNRLQYQGAFNAPTQSFTYSNVQLWGTTCPSGFNQTAPGAMCTKTGSAPVAPTVYNGTTGNTITIPGAYFQSTEADSLHGGSFEYDHVFGGDSGDVVSFTFDSSSAVGQSFSQSGVSSLTSTTIPAPSYSVFPGSKEVNSTALIRGNFNFGKLNVTLANYLNWYFQYYTQNAAASFTSAYPFHWDPRLGLTYRLNSDTSLRFSMGSAIAPPFLNLLEGASIATATIPNPVSGASSTFVSLAPANGLAPETAFGYDFGADARLTPDGYTVLSGDMYVNTIYNQFVKSLITLGSCTPGASSCALSPAGTITAYGLEPMNLGTSRFAGIELNIRRDPPVGFGGVFSGSLIRAFPFNVPASFYCANPPACSQLTNLGIVNGANYFAGNSISSVGGTSTGSGFNVITPSGGTAVPYSQGYFEFHYRTARGGLGLIGATYYGPNNPYNLPAFFVANATARFPIYDNQTFIQVSGDNIFNAYPSPVVSAFQGSPVILANGQTGLENANTVGPPVFRLELVKYFGTK